MTVSVTTRRLEYAGNGATTAFAVTWYFLANSHIQVYIRSSAGVETLKTITTHYTVTGAGNPAGGTVTMGTAPATGETLVIVRNVPLTQATDYVSNDPFPANTFEEGQDKLTMLCLMLIDRIERSVRLSAAADDGIDTVLPLIDSTKGNYVLTINSGGNGLSIVAPSAIATAGDAPVVSVQAGTSKSVATTDGNTLFKFANAGTCTITLPAGADAGMTVYGVNTGGGDIDWTATSGSIVGSYTTSAPLKIAAVVHLGSNVWATAGDWS